MIKKCLGCGVELQDNNILLDGYTSSLSNDFCMRCFKMRNYGDYEFVYKSNKEYLQILKNVGKTTSLVLFVIDLVNIPRNLGETLSYFKNNNVVLVLNKRDALPYSLSDDKISSHFDEISDNVKDVVIISTKNNYNLDTLMDRINLYKTDNVFVVGSTNAGKSSLINKIVDNYSLEKSSITISPMPSTTLSDIKIKMKDFTLIDTPGFVDDGSIFNFLDIDKIKKIQVKKEIKPRTYQIKNGESLIIDDFLRIDYTGEDNSFTLFISNDLNVKRIRSKKNDVLKDLAFRELKFKFKEDIVINGLGFIKTMYEGDVVIYCNKDIEIYNRKSLI